MGRLIRNGHIIRAIDLHESTGGGQLPRAAGEIAFKVDDHRFLLIVAGRLAVDVDDTDIVDDDVLRREDPIGELPDSLGGEGDEELVPERGDDRHRPLSVAGDDTHVAFHGRTSEGFRPEGDRIGLSLLDGNVNLQGRPVVDCLRGIIAGEDVIQVGKDLELVGDESIQGAGLEIPVLPEEGCLVVRSRVGDHFVQVGALLLAVPAERMAEKFVSA